MSGDSPLPPPGAATGQSQASAGRSAASSRAAKNKLMAETELIAETDKSALMSQSSATSAETTSIKKSTAGATSIPTSPKESLIRRELEQVILRACAETGLEEISALLLVSGGVDSMVLLHLLSGLREGVPASPPSTPTREGDVYKPTGMRLHSLHAITFQSDLRAAEAKLDTATIEETCTQLSVPFSMRELHIEKLAKTAGRTVNAKAELRAARYLAAQRHAASLGCNVILTGHHGDDRIETLLWKLAEGKTPSALLSPRVYDPESGWLRPLLTVRKETLRAYAKATGIVFHEDSMNTDEKYLRTRIRHEVLPVLQKTFPKVESSLLAFRDRLEVFYTLTDKLLAQSGGARAVGKAIALGTPLLSAEEFFSVPERKAILHRLLQRAYPMRRFSHGELNEIFRKLEGLAPSQRAPSPSTPNFNSDSNPNSNLNSNSNSVSTPIPILIPIGRKMLFALPLRQSSLEEDFLHEDPTFESQVIEGDSSSTQEAPIVATGKNQKTEKIHETEEIHYSRGIIAPLVTRRLIQVQTRSLLRSQSQSQAEPLKPQAEPWMKQLHTTQLEGSNVGGFIFAERTGFAEAAIVWEVVDSSKEGLEPLDAKDNLASLDGKIDSLDWQSILPQLAKQHRYEALNDPSNDFFVRQRLFEEIPDGSHPSREKWNLFAQHRLLIDPYDSSRSRSPHSSHNSYNVESIVTLRRLVPGVNKEKYLFRGGNVLWEKIFATLKLPVHCLADAWEVSITRTELIADPLIGKGIGTSSMGAGASAMEKDASPTEKGVLPTGKSVSTIEMSTESSVQTRSSAEMKSFLQTKPPTQAKSFTQVLGVCSPYGWFLRANECLREFSNNLILFGNNPVDKTSSKMGSTSDSNMERISGNFPPNHPPKNPAKDHKNPAKDHYRELVLSAYVAVSPMVSKS